MHYLTKTEEYRLQEDTKRLFRFLTLNISMIHIVSMEVCKLVINKISITTNSNKFRMSFILRLSGITKIPRTKDNIEMPRILGKLKKSMKPRKSVK